MTIYILCAGKPFWYSDSMALTRFTLSLSCFSLFLFDNFIFIGQLMVKKHTEKNKTERERGTTCNISLRLDLNQGCYSYMVCALPTWLPGCAIVFFVAVPWEEWEDFCPNLALLLYLANLRSFSVATETTLTTLTAWVKPVIFLMHKSKSLLCPGWSRSSNKTSWSMSECSLFWDSKFGFNLQFDAMKRGVTSWLTAEPC